MNYSNFRKIDTANGPGVRVSLYVSGCTNCCPGCFNKESWDFNYGQPFTKDDKRELIESLNKPYIGGLSILGGDPLHACNRETVAELVSEVKGKFGKDKTIWVWTGYTYEKLRDEKDAAIQTIFNNIDVLVDGPFVEAEKDLTLLWRGSSNQRVLKFENGLAVSLYD